MSENYAAEELDENGYVRGYGPPTEDEITPFLYVAVDGRYCKIGISNNPWRREKELWYWHPERRERRRFNIRHVWYVPRRAQRIETAVKRELREVRGLEYVTYESFKIKASDMLAVIEKCSAGMGRVRPMRNVTFGVIS